MKNTFGNSVSITLFGESHGAQIGAVLDGLAPGIPVSEVYIAARLSLNRTMVNHLLHRQSFCKNPLGDASRIVSVKFYSLVFVIFISF